MVAAPTAAAALFLALATTSIQPIRAQASPEGSTYRAIGEKFSVELFNATRTDTYLYGALHVRDRENQLWSHICESDLETDAGTVICRMFNFTRGEVVGGGYLGTKKSRGFTYEFSCSGSESSLDTCRTFSSASSCDVSKSVGLVCFYNINEVFQLRVVQDEGDSSPIQLAGRLEVRLAPPLPWGSVCDDLFSDVSATAACRHLGYKLGQEVSHGFWSFLFSGSGIYGSSERIWLDEVSCRAGQQFYDCDHDVWGWNDCSSAEDVGISCSNHSVRLLSNVPNDYHIGSVEVYLENSGGWYEVCDTDWDDQDAKVACKELGFQDGKALCCNTLGSVSYGSLTAQGSMTNFSCAGDESSLSDCSMVETDLCNFEGPVISLAAVICYDKPVSEIDMNIQYRIVPSAGGGLSDAGTLEIRYMGIWGRVCDDPHIFDHETSDKDINAVCRMMGKGYIGGRRIGGEVLDNEKHHIWLRGFECAGNESTIEECNIPSWGSPHLQDCQDYLRVICYRQELELSIVNPEKGHRVSGLLEIKYDGDVAHVCKDSWTDREANAACFSLGYYGGQAWSPSQESSSIMILSGVACKESSTNFFMCENHGWGLPTEDCQTHSVAAGVSCFTEVKLDPMYKNSGVLQIYDKTAEQWTTICRTGFDNVDATVACMQFGFFKGQLLSASAFGTFESEPGESQARSSVNCNGSETHISDCAFSTNLFGCNGFTDYVAISCFDTVSVGTYELENGYSDSKQASGILRVYQNNTWGYACDETFSNNDAKVYCQEIGRVLNQNYKDGVKFTPVKDFAGPYFVTYPGCTGAEGTPGACDNSFFLCSERMAVSLLCYDSDGKVPKLQLISDSGRLHSGRLQLEVGNLAGAICADQWDDLDASVACRQLSPDYWTGVAKRYNRTQIMYMSGIQCTGAENNLFRCSSDGWRDSSNANCQSDAQEAGVICFGRVYLSGIKQTAESISGSVNIRTELGINRPVCFEPTFGYKEAQVVCRELGYSQAAILAPGDFPYREPWDQYAYEGIQCVGSENSLTECERTYSGLCISQKHVRLLCYENKMNDLNKWSIEENNYGALTLPLFEQHYQGVICPLNWNDTNAHSVCVKKGFKGGRSLGGPKISAVPDKELVWFGSVYCGQSGNSASGCELQHNVSFECFDHDHWAGVLCYNDEDGIAVRLVDHGLISKHSGRVEILYRNVWGTVCNKNGKRLQARTICRELGMVDGIVRASTPKQFGTGSGPIYLRNVECSAEDTTLLGCSNAGWNDNTNCTHDDDLEVTCYSSERLYPEPEQHYGAVSLLVNGAYKLVCSDGFSIREAKVFCSALGHMRGVPICCSGLDVPFLEIGTARAHCTGREGTLMDCNLNPSGLESCPSNQFASVACSMSLNEQYSLTLEKGDRGRVLMNYFGITGGVCAEGFTKQDAIVICKELGFSSGLPFRTTNMKDFPVIWTSNMQCSGLETTLSSCENFLPGKTNGCREAATVLCLSESESLELDLRNIQRADTVYGRPEVQIGGTWGSICDDLSISDNEANVMCKQLGKSGGTFHRAGVPDRSAPPIILDGLKCEGDEANLGECQLYAFGYGDKASQCERYYDHALLQCFRNVELVNNPPGDLSRGQVMIFHKAEEQWQPVCDSSVGSHEATVICRSLGFQYGLHQCCNAFGSSKLRPSVEVSSLQCTGSEVSVSDCIISRTRECPDRRRSFASVYCSDTVFPAQNLHVESIQDFAGIPTVSQYGIEGYLCAKDVTDKEAAVVCRELGYFDGQLLKGEYKDVGSSFLLSDVKCNGQERQIKDCMYSTWDDGIKCENREAAKVLCIKAGSVSFHLPTNPGRAEMIIDGNTFVFANHNFGNEEANVFCQSVSDSVYLFGAQVRSPSRERDVEESIFMDFIDCKGSEKNILNCSATILPKFVSGITEGNLVYVECHKGVELQNGPTDYSGILSLYNSDAGEYGAVCSRGFGQNETDVACKMLGYEYGIAHCCLPFGYNSIEPLFKDFQCTGNEKSLWDCQKDVAASSFSAFCSRQDYVGISCYTGSKPEDFTVSIASESRDSGVGRVNITYLGIDGNICSDGFDDADAQVICKELGYVNGSSYTHYKSSFSLNGGQGPFWITNVQCKGTENRFAECIHSELGDLTQCAGTHYAGVLCTHGLETAYRLAGTNHSHYGRLEVRINGVWGSVCDRYWDKNDATVMCRHLGYIMGDTFNPSQLSEQGSGPVWEIGARCIGDETDLNDCPHDGWISDVSSSCSEHGRDAGLFCYSSVRLATGSGKSVNHGPVNLYHDNKWYRVCDDGFTDTSARVVCQQLGYFDGRAMCCSAYSGETINTETILPNVTLECGPTTNELEVAACEKSNPCVSGLYASVICLENGITYDEKEYEVSMEEDADGIGRLQVKHMGITGRVCSNGWTNTEADVFCRSQNYVGGFAYFHSYAELYVSARAIGPYFMSNVNCNGTETDLTQCKFDDKTSLGNCTSSHTASVICYQRNGIQYRLASDAEQRPNAGRVEMALDGRWGTVCDSTWDDNDAKVVCKERGYKDGTALKNAEYGEGSGPIWLWDIQCSGEESYLHQCPLSGFYDNEADGSFSWFTPPCSLHSNDASVYCFKDVKLNQPLTMMSGGLLYNLNDEWVYICSSDAFTRTEATAACKGLMNNYVEGLPIKGGLFGKLDAPITPHSFSCSGSEATLSDCKVAPSSGCASNTYMSVTCFTNLLTADDMKFDVILSDDSIRTNDNHGILEIRQNGVWGRVCMLNFTDVEADVACKQLGYSGGNVYLHLFRNRLPILWSGITCAGDEVSLEDCQRDETLDMETCHYEANDAGVVCYKNEAVKYRLSGGDTAMTGRVEIGIDGEFGSVCAVNWQQGSAKVLCKTLGYVDGIPSHNVNEDLPPLDPIMSFFLCQGNESTLLSCLNSGFDKGAYVFICGGEAYATCYNEEIKISKVRIGGGQAMEGRVEVYATAVEEWGTVCDDNWDDNAARVVCMQLGFDDGVAIEDGYEFGEGLILMDNVECQGNEKNIGDCSYTGINSHNCLHSEDAGIRCFNNSGTSPPIVSTGTTPTTTTTTTHASSATTRTTSTSTTTSTTTTTSTPKMEFSTTLNTITTKVTPEVTPKPSSTRQPPETTTSTSTAAPKSVKQLSEQEDENTGIIVAVCISIVVAIILIAVVIFVVYKYKIRAKGGIPHERFDDSIVRQAPDGSLTAHNRVYDMVHSEGDDPLTQYMADGSEIQMDRSGCVSFSKGSPVAGSDDVQEGFSNPLYAVSQICAETSVHDINVEMNGSNHGFKA